MGEARTKRLAGTVVVLLLCQPASAQQYGQWTWDGIFSLGQRAYQNFVDEDKVSAIDQRELNFGLNVNGFILHPRVADFRAGIDGSFTKAKSFRDSTRWGFRGNVNLFPRGLYRANIFAVRQLYDFSDITEEDPITLRGFPEASTTLGGRFRITGGRLSGTLIGLQRTSLDLRAPEAGSEIQSRQFFNWTRSRTDLSRSFRLERRYRDAGLLQYKNENVTVNYNQRHRLSDTWRYDMAGIGILQNSSYDNADTNVNSLRFRTDGFHDIRETDLLDLRYSGALLRGDGFTSFYSHELGTRYRWRLRPGMELSPFARYGIRRSSRVRFRSPNVGMAATWNRRGRGRVDVLVNGSFSLGTIQQSDDTNSRKDTVIGFASNFLIGSGRDTTLRIDVEGDAGRDQVRIGEEAIGGLPELGLPLVRSGVEDFLRGRLTARRAWGSFLFSAYGEWARRAPSTSVDVEGFTIDEKTFVLQLQNSRLNFSVNFGDQDIRQPNLIEPQRIDFVSAAGSLKPWRLLRLTASYRKDQRLLTLAPNVDGSRAEMGFDLSFGAFVLEARAFTFTESQVAGIARTNRGATWSLRRGFAGWLPVVTRGPRVGQIR